MGHGVSNRVNEKMSQFTSIFSPDKWVLWATCISHQTIGVKEPLEAKGLEELNAFLTLRIVADVACVTL